MARPSCAHKSVRSGFWMSQKPWRLATRIALPTIHGRAHGNLPVARRRTGNVGAHTSGVRNFHCTGSLGSFQAVSLARSGAGSLRDGRGGLC